MILLHPAQHYAVSLPSTTTSMAVEAQHQQSMLSLAADGAATTVTRPAEVGPGDHDNIGGLDRPSHPDHDWWWQRTAPMLATLLRSAGSYTQEQQLDHLRAYRDAVVPTYGPPTPAAKVRPLLTMDGSPFEPSWNFQNDVTLVRYSFEPLIPNADPQNPFLGDCLPTLLPLFRYVAPGADTRWLEQVWQQWFLSDKAEVDKAKSQLPPHKTRVPQIFLAFDMKGAQRLMKVYLFPVLKHLATGISTDQLAWDAILNLKPGGERFKGPVDKLSRFLSSYKEPLPVEMIAIDCIDPARARIKVYARTKTNSKATIRDCCTLGGTQTDDMTMHGVEHVTDIWHLIMDEPTGLAEDQCKPPRYPNDHHLGICFVFEMRLDQDRIEVKCHLPWAQTNSKDLRTIANFTDSLERLGYHDHAARFARGALSLATL